MVAMAAKVEWTSDLVETLIESVHLYKVAWDTQQCKLQEQNCTGINMMQIASDCGLEGKAL